MGSVRAENPHQYAPLGASSKRNAARKIRLRSSVVSVVTQMKSAEKKIA